MWLDRTSRAMHGVHRHAVRLNLEDSARLRWTRTRKALCERVVGLDWTGLSLDSSNAELFILDEKKKVTIVYQHHG